MLVGIIEFPNIAWFISLVFSRIAFFVYLVLRSISTNSDLVFLIGHIGPKISTKMLDDCHRSFHTTHIHRMGILQILVTSRVIKNAFGFQFPSDLYTSQKASHLPR